MKGKTKKVDKLAMRLTADRVLKGTASAGQFKYFQGLFQNIQRERDESGEQKDDSLIGNPDNSLRDETV